MLFFTSVGVRAEQVDVQILLAIDVSSSVNYEEFDLQMRGYIAAFRTPEVLEAIQSGAHGKIAVAMTQWAGLQQQRLVLDWTIVSNADEAERVAGQIEYVPRAFPFGGTAITNALRHSYKQFDKSPYISQRKVIDISGDGRPSIGKEPAKLRDEIIGSGVTINGLPILNEEPDLDRYYVKNVLGGVGAFAEVAADYSDFSRAISRKLAQEIKGVFYGM
ncbi:hypothetical protein A9Q83_09920 [Alphaproteobacteria bacterium 46_93_T64]|nr:hypothetical protein A9Q83_09920 [Alphaproteobacteria bacterium 46_93_T64]